MVGLTPAPEEPTFASIIISLLSIIFVLTSGANAKIEVNAVQPGVDT